MTINLTALFQRVLELMTNPKRTWETIAAEPDRGSQLVTRYVLLLAIIPTACGFLGVILFDSRLTFGDRFFFSLLSSLLKLIVFVGSVYILGMLVNAMAPSFDTKRSRNLSMKVMAYASTPVWIAGFVTLVPQLTILAALGGYGYSTYLFYLGTQTVLGTPPNRALGFSFAAVVSWFVLSLITALIVVQIAGLLFTPALLVDRLVQQPHTPIP